METKEKLEVNLSKEEIAAFVVNGIVAARDDIAVNTEFTITFKYGSENDDYGGVVPDVLIGAKVVFTR